MRAQGRREPVPEHRPDRRLWVVERLFALLTYRNRMVAGAEIPIDSSTH